MLLGRLLRLASGMGLASAVVGGCLSVPAASSSETSDSTGGDCITGSRGCPCYGNQTCDAGLECFDATACFPPGCTAGTQACPCLSGGGCDVGLACEGAQCAPAGTSGGTESTTAATDTGATDPTGASATEGGSSTAGELCDPEDDDTICDACEKTHCCDEWTACLDAPVCAAMLECVAPNTPFSSCAAMHSGGGPVFLALSGCIASKDVADECHPCAPPTVACTGERLPAPVYLPCTECAAINCCGEYQACLADPFCTCMEGCLADPKAGGDYTTCIQALCSDLDASTGVYPTFATCATDAGCATPAESVACYPANDPG